MSLIYDGSDLTKGDLIWSKIPLLCLWGGALRDEPKNGGEGDYQTSCLTSKVKLASY